MPQLFSRMDDLNWLTPTIADVLEQGAPPPGGDGSIRQQMLLLQQRLVELETPARVINVRPTPSYTLFVVRPESAGRLGNKRLVAPSEIKRSLGTISEENRDWRLGFLPAIPDTPETVGILLRTSEHQPLSLRRMLVRSSFRDHESRMAFPVGNTLDQQLEIIDLAAIGRFAIIGTDASVRQRLLFSVLMTLLLLNTPGELRLALIGASTGNLMPFTQTPHIIGRPLTSPQDGARLMHGLSVEIKRRQELLESVNLNTIERYNQYLHENGQTVVPRLLLIIESLSDTAWQDFQGTFRSDLVRLLVNGGPLGVHVIITADEPVAPHVPASLNEISPNFFILGANAGEYPGRVESFHGSLLRFVDGFAVRDDGQTVTPLEVPAVSADEIKSLISYWHHAAKQRQQEDFLPRVSGKTGVTQELDQETAMRAIEAQRAKSSDVESQAAVVAEVESGRPPLTNDVDQPPQVSLQQAQALAAYLGWIGVGPLQDILGLTPDEAVKTLTALRIMGIVEDNDSATPRFLRLIN